MSKTKKIKILQLSGKFHKYVTKSQHFTLYFNYVLIHYMAQNRVYISRKISSKIFRPLSKKIYVKNILKMHQAHFSEGIKNAEAQCWGSEKFSPFLWKKACRLLAVDPRTPFLLVKNLEGWIINLKSCYWGVEGIILSLLFWYVNNMGR